MASGLFICNVALITSHFGRPLAHTCTWKSKQKFDVLIINICHELGK